MHVVKKNAEPRDWRDAGIEFEMYPIARNGAYNAKRLVGVVAKKTFCHCNGVTEDFMSFVIYNDSPLSEYLQGKL